MMISLQERLNAAKARPSATPFRGVVAVIFSTMLAGCAGIPSGDSGKTVSTPPELPSTPHKARVNVAPQPRPLTGKALVGSLLPPALGDRSGWAEDVVAAFEAIRITPSKENICAVLAEIGQESSFQTDPVVLGLSKIVRDQLEANRVKYGIPKWLMDRSLAMKSPGGQTYNERIAALRTENDLNNLYQDMISEIPLGRKFLADYNPVQTIGPMQINLSFANSYVATRRYAYQGSLRDALLTRKGGLYFGVAYLLDYPASYDSIRFRFADFNAGRYSSRNAAFQNALRSLTGFPLIRDGDLLRYKNGVAIEGGSQTMRALLSISSTLKMDKADIFNNLLLEKSAAFEQSPLYAKVFALAPSMPRAFIPEIVVSGPKTSGKLTTALYAQKVEGRYRRCLSQ